jgi:hypothetical protein
MSELNWIEGTSGKGLVFNDGEIETWTVGEDGTPIHGDYAIMHGIDMDPVIGWFEIDPMGDVRSSVTNDLEEELKPIIEKADPRLHVHLDPSWHFGSLGLNGGQPYTDIWGKEHVTDPWEPGMMGKAIVHNGQAYIWGDLHESPHHDQVYESLNPPNNLANRDIADRDWEADYRAAPKYHIHPDGSFDSPRVGLTNERSGIDTSAEDTILAAAHPALHPQPNVWSFEGSYSRDQLDWDEGNEGKGIIDRQGNVYTWNTDDYEIHQHFLEDHPGIVPEYYLEIEPDGRVSPAGLNFGSDLVEVEDLLRDADPRLHVEPYAVNSPTGWNFN